MNKDIQIRINKIFYDVLEGTVKVFDKEYGKPFQIQAVPPTSEPLKIKQKVIIKTYYGPWHNATGFVVEALGKGMYKVSVTNLGTTRVLSFHRSELTEVTT